MLFRAAATIAVLTFTFTSTAAGQTGTGTGLKGEYFPNTELKAPVALTRTDAAVNFTWATNSPLPTFAPDKFSIRWSGKVEAPVTGTYTFVTRSDDGVRLWVNQKLIINNWSEHGADWDQSVPVTLTAGQKYDIQLEYFENKGNALIQLYWSYPNQAEQVIPQIRLYPQAITLQPPPPVMSRRWVSDLNWITATNGWGPVELDRSNGEQAPKDGRTMSIAGRKYSSGLGVHSKSEVRYPLLDRYDVFRAIVGVDDEVGDRGSVVFEVWLDGRKVFTSPVIKGSMPGLAIEVPVENAREMKLVVTDAGDGISYDHANWAEARLEGVESVRYLSSMNWMSATNGLGPVERDRTNGGAAEKDGERIKLAGMTYSRGLGSWANAEIRYDLDQKYERFSAVIGIDDSVGNTGSAIFEVWADNIRLYRSQTMRGNMPSELVSVIVTGRETLLLKVLDAGDGTVNDAADWGDAQLLPRNSDTTPGSIPAAPTELDADAGNGSVKLTWKASAGATSYQVFRGLTSGGQENTPIATNIAGTTYTNTGLTNGTRYYYRLKAINNFGASGYSSQVSAVPTVVIPAPTTAPSNVVATPSDTKITLNWNAVSGATGYRIFRGTTSGGQSSTPVGTVNGTSFGDAGLTNGTAYFYKVAAFNTGGQGPMSAQVSATPTTALTAPSVTATAGDAQITLAWPAVAGAAGYRVFRGTTSGGQSSTPIATVNGNSFVNTGLTNGTAYFYKVAAFNNGGQGPMSAQVSATPKTSLTAPSGLTATPGDTQVTLAWSAVQGATGYRVFRSTTSGGQSSTPLTTVNTPTFVNTGLTNNTTYYYKVAAFSATGQGPMSAEVSGKPVTSLTAPTNLTATPGDREITLTWSGITGATSYKVFRATTSNGQTTTAIATASGTSFTNTGLTNGTAYFYKVAAVNATGQSPLSAEATATPTTSLTAPANFTATAGDSKVTLTWAAVTGATSYRVFRGATSNGQGTTAIASPSGTTYTNTGLTNGTDYFYKVASVNSGGQSPMSVEVKVTPLAIPVAPTGLTTSGGDRTITLSWPAVAGATSYNVYRGTTTNGQATTPIAADVTATTFQDTGLTNGTTYYYKLTAKNASGEGARSAAVAGTPVSPAPTIDEPTRAAYRLLRQATWGPKPGELARVKQIGAAAFLAEQFAAPPSTYPDTLYDQSLEWTQEYFTRLALTGPDQLRQRVAFALHKIWVVSGVEVNRSDSIINYYRIMMNRAFGNYRDIMRDVTTSPAMGRYLNMLNNKSQASSGVEPNENYGRELMQLFTLGLVRLNPDGSPMLDGQGRPIPSYSEEDVKAVSRMLTGWTFGDGNPNTIPNNLASSNDRVPMEPVERFHDTTAKVLLGNNIPPGLPARQEMEQALDILFNHPNLPVFVSKQLIQMLVKSNPSPAYVQAVQNVFVNNGSNVRGDLMAVVRAILTHPEATGPSSTGNKLMEPVLFVVSQLRSLDATVADHPFMTDKSEEMGQKVLYPPSVFSYFSPGFRIRGTSLGGPEFQIYTSVTSLVRINFIAQLISGGFGADVTINYQPFVSLATDAGALVDYCNLLFQGGNMSAEMRNEIINAVQATPATNTTERVRTALYLTMAGAQYQVDR